MFLHNDISRTVLLKSHISSNFYRCANINLNVSDGDITRQAEIFKKVCSEYINTFDVADDNIFDEQQISGSHTRKETDENWDPRENSSDEEESDKKDSDRKFLFLYKLNII